MTDPRILSTTPATGRLRTAGLNGIGVIFAALMPLATAAAFIVPAFVAHPHHWWRSWAPGLLVLMPLEFVRALILSMLSDAYKNSDGIRGTVKSFLLSAAILLVAGLLWMLFSAGIKGSIEMLSNSFLLELIGLPLLIFVVESTIGIFLFHGDRSLLVAQLDAVAADTLDLLGLFIGRLPIVFVPICVALFWSSAAGWRATAWVPPFSADVGMRLGLIYAGCYFVIKAAVVAHTQTSRFASTRRALLDVPWMVRVRNESK